MKLPPIRDNYLRGLTKADLKKYPENIPMFIIMASGLCWAGFYLIRLATKHPDVSWNRRGNPEPWNEYANKQYKFLSAGRDYSKGSPAPKYK